MSDIRFHWMQHRTDIYLDTLKKLSKDLDDAGYYSVLLPFHSLGSDFLIKCAHILDFKQKIKYMIALRPYHVSPQYYRMLVRAFCEIQEKRLIINIIAGDGRKEEPDQMDFLGETKNLITVDQRKEFVRNFLSIQDKDDWLRYYLPDTVVSGLSDYSVETASMFGHTILCMYDEYFDNIERLKSCKRRMVSAKMYIRDTDEEANNIINLTDDTRLPKYTLYGTEESVLGKIKEAISLGVTDFLIGGCDFDKEKHRIHEFIKKIQSML